MFTVNDELISSIGKGLCVLVGISRDDTKEDMEYMWVHTRIGFNKTYLKHTLKPFFCDIFKIIEIYRNIICSRIHYILWKFESNLMCFKFKLYPKLLNNTSQLGRSYTK